VYICVCVCVCVCVCAYLILCDMETSTTRWSSPELGSSATKKYFLAKKFLYSDADKSLARPGRKEATATEDFDFHISYL
jgi:hypothetical protein